MSKFEIAKQYMPSLVTLSDNNKMDWGRLKNLSSECTTFSDVIIFAACTIINTVSGVRKVYPWSESTKNIINLVKNDDNELIKAIKAEIITDNVTENKHADDMVNAIIVSICLAFSVQFKDSVMTKNNEIFISDICKQISSTSTFGLEEEFVDDLKEMVNKLPSLISFFLSDENVKSVFECVLSNKDLSDIEEEEAEDTTSTSIEVVNKDGSVEATIDNTTSNATTATVATAATADNNKKAMNPVDDIESILVLLSDKFMDADKETFNLISSSFEGIRNLEPNNYTGNNISCQEFTNICKEELDKNLAMLESAITNICKNKLQVLKTAKQYKNYLYKVFGQRRRAMANIVSSYTDADIKLHRLPIDSVAEAERASAKINALSELKGYSDAAYSVALNALGLSTNKEGVKPQQPSPAPTATTQQQVVQATNNVVVNQAVPVINPIYNTGIVFPKEFTDNVKFTNEELLTLNNNLALVFSIICDRDQIALPIIPSMFGLEKFESVNKFTLREIEVDYNTRTYGGFAEKDTNPMQYAQFFINNGNVTLTYSTNPFGWGVYLEQRCATPVVIGDTKSVDFGRYDAIKTKMNEAFMSVPQSTQQVIASLEKALDKADRTVQMVEQNIANKAQNTTIVQQVGVNQVSEQVVETAQATSQQSETTSQVTTELAATTQTTPDVQKESKPVTVDSVATQVRERTGNRAQRRAAEKKKNRVIHNNFKDSSNVKTQQKENNAVMA